MHGISSKNMSAVNPPVFLVCVLLSIGLSLSAQAQSSMPGSRDAAIAGGKAKENGAKPPEVDSEHLFGFTEGSDIGNKGEVEGEVLSESGFGKRSGAYAASTNALQLKYSVTDNFRIAPTALISYHNISGVPDIDDRRQFAFEGLGVELRYRLLNRAHAPFGFTISVDPHWTRVEASTGAPVENYGVGFTALLDKELVKDRIFAAFNMLYRPEWTKFSVTGEQQRASTFGISGSIVDQIFPGIFIGGELRYFRHYHGIELSPSVGEALFGGPALYVVMSERWNVTLAWSPQLWGRAADMPGSLDLSNFERQQVRVRIGMNF
jgi:hypothetical protein